MTSLGLLNVEGSLLAAGLDDLYLGLVEAKALELYDVAEGVVVLLDDESAQQGRENPLDLAGRGDLQLDLRCCPGSYPLIGGGIGALAGAFALDQLDPVDAIVLDGLAQHRRHHERRDLKDQPVELSPETGSQLFLEETLDSLAVVDMRSQPAHVVGRRKPEQAAAAEQLGILRRPVDQQFASRTYQVGRNATAPELKHDAKVVAFDLGCVGTKHFLAIGRFSREGIAQVALEARQKRRTLAVDVSERQIRLLPATPDPHFVKCSAMPHLLSPHGNHKSPPLRANKLPHA